MNPLNVLLWSALSISVVLSCHQDDECSRHAHCSHDQEGVCVYGHCRCVDSRCDRNSDCPSCHDSLYPHCNQNLRICDCEVCIHNSHCQHCPAGMTGMCRRNRQTQHLYCECTDNIELDITTTTTTTTTTKPLVPLDCSHQKISVIESIAENVHVEDDRAGLCPGTNKHQTSDALVIHKCNATARSSWSKGVSVKSLCPNGSLTPYTPVSTFHNHGDEMAAFFIDCTADGGLKVAVQTCNDPPKVLMVTETTSPKASDFYTILQHYFYVEIKGIHESPGAPADMEGDLFSAFMNFKKRRNFTMPTLVT